MMRKRKWIFLFAIIILVILALPEIFYKNRGHGKAIGTTHNGKLHNAYLLPYSGKNFNYFSLFSYYILDNAYTHSKVHNTILEAYRECEKTCKNVHFRIMECSRKNGGKMLIHRTHQNGLSVDFMVPKKKNDQQIKLYDRIGIWHYLLDFTNSGQLIFDNNTKIDFETMGKHILALDKAAKRNGLRIKKIILKTNLKDDFYQIESGKKVQQKGIYIVRSLPYWANRVHDDHYHVDFEIVD